MDRTLIDQYEACPGRLREAVAGLSPEQLRWVPPADAGLGLWSVHQIVIHLADSDAIAVHRMKRIIAEENPLLIGYDESGFVRTLSYHEQSIDEALTLIELGRRGMALVLRKLPDEAFHRRGVHNERGTVRLGQLVGDYIEHVDHHLKYIRLKREAMVGRS